MLETAITIKLYSNVLSGKSDMLLKFINFAVADGSYVTEALGHM